jgi:hypothetical protein
LAELMNLPKADELAAGPMAETFEVNADSKEAYERGKTDINFFAGLLLPTVMVSALPAFYLGVFKVLVSRTALDIGKILRFALGLPRGHAKTTFIKIIICWMIVYDKISFAIVICANSGLAEALMSDISDALGSDNCEAIYGSWTRQLVSGTDNKEEKKCFYHGRPVILKAVGAGGAIRGVNIKHIRPDFILFDDAQTKECDESPTESLKFKQWFIATLKIIAPRGDRLIIWIGNMYSDQCILYQLKNNPKWISLITGAILEDGQPLWPELHSLESLMESYVHDEAMGEAAVWFAEVMNDPVSKSTSLLDSVLEAIVWDTETVPDGVFITIDPAGFREAADDNVIVVHYVFNQIGFVVDIETEVKDPEQLILRSFQLAVQHGASLIGVEDVAYQQTLLFWFKKYINEFNVHGIEIVPLKPAGRSKESRIRLFIAALKAKHYNLFDAIKAIFIWQAMKYKVGQKKNKDDILDACAYGLDVRNEYWHLVKNMRQAGQFLLGSASVVGNNTPF